MNEILLVASLFCDLRMRASGVPAVWQSGLYCFTDMSRLSPPTSSADHGESLRP